MPKGTSKNWRAFNVEEMDRRHRAAAGHAPSPSTDIELLELSVLEHLQITRKYVIAFNHTPGHKDKISDLGNRYRAGLSQFNVCWKCYKPLRVESKGVQTSGTVQSHCETTHKGGKLSFRFIDGTERQIDWNQKQFVVRNEDGTEDVIHPEISYLVYDKKCECKD